MTTEPTTNEPTAEATTAETPAETKPFLPEELANNLRASLETAITEIKDPAWYAVMHTLLDMPAITNRHVERFGGAEQANQRYQEERKTSRALLSTFHTAAMARGLVQLLELVIGRDIASSAKSLETAVAKKAIARGIVDRLATRLCGSLAGVRGVQALEIQRSATTAAMSSPEFLADLEAEAGPLTRKDLVPMANPTTLVDGVALLQLLIKRGQLHNGWQTMIETVLEFASVPTHLDGDKPVDWSRCYFGKDEHDELLFFHLLGIQAILNSAPDNPRYSEAREAGLRLLQVLTYPELYDSVIADIKTTEEKLAADDKEEQEAELEPAAAE